jgi:hypothetical protein
MKIADGAIDILMKISHRLFPRALPSDCGLLTLCIKDCMFELVSWHCRTCNRATRPERQEIGSDVAYLSYHVNWKRPLRTVDIRQVAGLASPCSSGTTIGPRIELLCDSANMRDNAASQRLLSLNVLLPRMHIDYSAIPLRAGRTRFCGAS